MVEMEEVLVLDLAKAFETVSLSPSGLGLGDALQLPKEDIAGAERLFRAPEASTVGRMCGRAAQDHYGHLARVQVELLIAAYCVTGRAE